MCDLGCREYFCGGLKSFAFGFADENQASRTLFYDFSGLKLRDPKL